MFTLKLNVWNKRITGTTSSHHTNDTKLLCSFCKLNNHTEGNCRISWWTNLKDRDYHDYYRPPTQLPLFSYAPSVCVSVSCSQRLHVSARRMPNGTIKNYSFSVWHPSGDFPHVFTHSNNFRTFPHDLPASAESSGMSSDLESIGTDLGLQCNARRVMFLYVCLKNIYI
jgi:hypothetical protein